MAPFSGTPKAQAQSLPRLGRADLVTEAAAEWPFPPSDVLWPLGPRCRPRLAHRGGRSLPLLLCAFPGTSPGRGRARHGLRIANPRPGLQRLPTTPEPSGEAGLRGRSCGTHHPVTGLRSVLICAFSLLFLRFSATRPPRSTPMKREVSKRHSTNTCAGPSPP